MLLVCFQYSIYKKSINSIVFLIKQLKTKRKKLMVSKCFYNIFSMKFMKMNIFAESKAFKSYLMTIWSLSNTYIVNFFVERNDKLYKQLFLDIDDESVLSSYNVDSKNAYFSFQLFKNTIDFLSKMYTKVLQNKSNTILPGTANI